MPSPALEALKTLPLTPLSSEPNSPASSHPPSRRSSQTRSSLTTPNNPNSSLIALTTIKNLNKQQERHATEGNGEIEEAAEEVDGADLDDATKLRTGNDRFRKGSRRLSRMSSILGEGVTAHWSSSQIPSKATLKASPTALFAELPSDGPVLPGSTPSSPSKSVLAHPQTPGNTECIEADPHVGLSPIENAKRLAAYMAVDVHIKAHHKVIGIGSGSTVPYVVDRILELGKQANAKRWVGQFTI